MPSLPRSLVIDPREVGIYHCFTKVTQDLFLFGKDSRSGADFRYRKTWLRAELQHLASCMAVEVLDYALLDNHFHLLLRNRPDVVEKWSDEECVVRLDCLFPETRDAEGKRVEPTPWQIRLWAKDASRVKKARHRLSNISWFLRVAKQRIARRANQEQGTTGHFWGGRFKAKRIRDEAALLACSMYINLNLIRAGIARELQDSEYTSVYDRIHSLSQEQDLLGWLVAHPACTPNFTELTSKLSESSGRGPLPCWATDSTSRPQQTTDPPPPQATSDSRSPAAWLAPLFLDERPTAYSAAASMQVRAEGASPELVPQSNPFPSPRATNKGYLPVTLSEYLLLLDWTQQGLNPHATTPPESRSIATVLQRLGLDPHQWLTTLRNGLSRYGKWIVSPSAPSG